MQEVLDNWMSARPDPCTCANGTTCANCRAWHLSHPAYHLPDEEPPSSPLAVLVPSLVAYQEMRARRRAARQTQPPSRREAAPPL